MARFIDLDELFVGRHFETIEELRQTLLAFRETYNTTWLIEPLVTPCRNLAVGDPTGIMVLSPVFPSR
jgi:hypothetical protein